MSTAALPLPVLEQTFGTIYGIQMASTFIACALYGVLGLQVFIYYMNNPKDPFLLKLLPLWLLILETIHQFVYCVGIYKVSVNHFGDANVFIINFKEGWIATIFQGFISISAHMFFIFRIWMFGQKKWIVPAICIPLTCFQLALVLADNISGYMSGLAILPSQVWITYTAHSVNIFLDTFFVVAMIVLLKRETNSAFKRTRNMIDRMVFLTVNTGLVTTLCTLLTIVLLRVQPNTLTYVFFNILVSPFYCNSVLANLNSRDYIRGRPQHGSGATGSSEPSTVLELGRFRSGQTGSNRPNFKHQPSGGSATQVGRTSDYESEFVPAKAEDSFINIESHVSSTRM